jgi:hypothetical protein
LKESEPVISCVVEEDEWERKRNSEEEKVREKEKKGNI